MASRFLEDAQRGASRGSLDLPLALLAGLSVGFVAFVLPKDILAEAVQAIGLPSILPAAAPPLGDKAGAAVAVAAALATLAAVYLLLRALGRETSPPRRSPFEDPDEEPQTLRLRRADIHPDAPARRPILAARELGEPVPPSRPADEAAREPEAIEEPLELGGPGLEMIEAEAEPIEVELELEPEPESLAEVAEPQAPAPEPQPEPEPDPEPKAEPVGDSSIPDLMARLERGLARKRVEKAVAAPAPAAPPAPTFDVPSFEGGDGRLRSAIENLQRMASRAG